MNGIYQDPEAASDYTGFLNSQNGKIQQEILYDAIAAALPQSSAAALLDAACGNGWLAERLKARYPKTYACDVSDALSNGGQSMPDIQFARADLEEALPYSDNFFDAIILNMAAPDIADLPAAIKNLAAKLKTGGTLIMTVPNPSLTYPAAVWKRSIADVLLRRKPRLIMRENYYAGGKINREFNGRKIPSHFYRLGEYLNAPLKAGLTLRHLRELKSRTDSPDFDLHYQMFRYPLLLLMEFLKKDTN